LVELLWTRNVVPRKKRSGNETGKKVRDGGLHGSITAVIGKPTQTTSTTIVAEEMIVRKRTTTVDTIVETGVSIAKATNLGTQEFTAARGQAQSTMNVGTTAVTTHTAVANMIAVVA
jgi:hypothetical protein